MSRQIIKAEMAGAVLGLSCAVGEAVTAGQELLLMESMKMEIPVLAGAVGTVIEILVAPGDSVTEGQGLVAIES